VGNGLGKAPLGGSEMKAWTDRKHQETVGNRLGRAHGQETVGNSLGRARWEGARWKRGRTGDAWGESFVGRGETEAIGSVDGRTAWSELRWEGAKRKHGRTGNRGK